MILVSVFQNSSVRMVGDFSSKTLENHRLAHGHIRASLEKHVESDTVQLIDILHRSGYGSQTSYSAYLVSKAWRGMIEIVILCLWGRVNLPDKDSE